VPTLNPNLLSEETALVLNDAVQLMRQYRQTNIFPEIVLMAMLENVACTAHQILHNFQDTRGVSLQDLARQTRLAVETRKDPNGDLELLTGEGRVAQLSRQMIIALDEALSIAQSVDEVYIDTDHLLTAFTEGKLGTAPILSAQGITQGAMMNVLRQRHDATMITPRNTPKPQNADDVARSNTTNDWVAEAQNGRLRAVYFRENLLRDVFNLVSQARSRHVILIGEDGVGKRSLAYSFALVIAEGKGPAGLNSMVQIKEEALLDNSVESVQIAVRQAKGGIVFVPHIHRFFGTALKAQFPKAGANLQKAFLGTDPVIIGTTTLNEWETRLAEIPAIRENSQILRVPAATLEETTEILSVLKPHIAADYKIKIAKEALDTATKLADRYIKSSPLPRSAEHLMHRAAASVNMGQQKELAFKVTATNDTLDAEDVTLAAAQMTGIPVSKLGQDERTKYASMVEHLQTRIIGQSTAVMSVSRAVKIARVGLRPPKRPIGSFLFLGPSGVGKTELAKALAEFMFDTEAAMLQLDMSEYMDENSISRLIGAPPGYVGYEGGGQLTDRVREQPYIVVLFDEIEKAHPRVLDLLLQVLDEGRLTDSQGNIATFSEAVVILTSNLGAKHITETTITPTIEDAVMQDVKAELRPEFINRLDDVIVFHPLSVQNLRQILVLMLNKEKQLAAANGLSLEFSEASIDWMVAQNDEPQYGARPLRRIIQRYLREPLADFLLQDSQPQNATVQVDVNPAGDALAFVM